jgi:hypothetical protein
LFAAIDDSASSATIGKGTVEFKLVKREQVTWGRLSTTGENANLQERRLEGQERSFKAQADAVDKKKEEHRLMQKAAVQKQIDQVRFPDFHFLRPFLSRRFVANPAPWYRVWGRLRVRVFHAGTTSSSLGFTRLGNDY